MTVAHSGPSTRRSPGATGGGGGRSSVRWRKSPRPNSTAVKETTRSTSIDRRPARRTSMRRPDRTCCPVRLAGIVAASFAMTRSPGSNRRTTSRRRQCRRCPSRSIANSFPFGGRCAGTLAAIIISSPASTAPRPPASQAPSRWYRQARGPRPRAVSTTIGPRQEPRRHGAVCPCRQDRMTAR